MKYADKLKGFVGREGLLVFADVNTPYIQFHPDSEGFLIHEVGDDYVVFRDIQYNRKFSEDKSLIFIPLNLLVFSYWEKI